MTMRSGLLKSRNFRALVTARTLVFFGNAIGTVGLSFGILGLPGGSGAELGIILFAQSLSQIALLLVGGVLADRYVKTRLMMTADLLAGASQLCIGVAVVMNANNLAFLALMAAINGGATGLFMPASTGILPEVVERSMLQSANATLRMSINVANIAGAAMAALLVSTAGSGASLVTNSGMYFGSVFFLSRLRLVRAGQPQGVSFLRELADGWRTFAGHRWVWMIVAQAALINALYRGSIQIFGPVEAASQPNGPALWAFALGAQTAGLFVGSVVAFRVRARHPLRVAAVCISMLSLPILFLGLDVSLVAVAAAMFVAGVAVDLFTVLWDTALQRNIDPAMLSRVSSYDTVGSFALAPLGLVAAGSLADSSIRGLALDVAGVTVLVVGLAVLQVADVRRLTHEEPAPQAADH